MSQMMIYSNDSCLIIFLKFKAVVPKPYPQVFAACIFRCLLASNQTPDLNKWLINSLLQHMMAGEEAIQSFESGVLEQKQV